MVKEESKVDERERERRHDFERGRVRICSMIGRTLAVGGRARSARSPVAWPVGRPARDERDSLYCSRRWNKGIT